MQNPENGACLMYENTDCWKLTEAGVTVPDSWRRQCFPVGNPDPPPPI